MQPRRRRGGWGGPQGGLRGGNEETSGGHNVEMKDKEKSLESSNSSTSDIEESSGEDSLDYGSQGSELSALLDEELHQVEGEVLSMPDEGWMEVDDEILGGVVSMMDTSADQAEENEKAQCGIQNDEVEENVKVEAIIKKRPAKTVIMMMELMNVKLHEQGEDEGDEDELCDGAKFLQFLDRDFYCSPRLIVRGIYVGEVLKLEVRRKTEGNLVHWSIFDMHRQKYVLSVNAQMEYQYNISRKAQGTSEGVKVLGGWNWRGWGYGFLNLFPPSDPRVLHVDVEEAIFYGEEVNDLYHVSGRNCKNIEKAEGVVCKEDGCGLRIHSVTFITFETAEEQTESYQPRSWRKERQVQYVLLSLVAFYSGQYKICVHRGARLKKYHEEVAWLTKDEVATARYSDSVEGVDQLKIEKEKLIWETPLPKRRAEGDILTKEVNILG